MGSSYLNEVSDMAEGIIDEFGLPCDIEEYEVTNYLGFREGPFYMVLAGDYWVGSLSFEEAKAMVTGIRRACDAMRKKGSLR